MKKIRLRLIIAIGLLVAVFTTVLLYRMHVDVSRNVDQLFHHQLDMAMNFDQSIQKYVADEIRPMMFDLLPEGEFVPQAMSTKFAAREIFTMVQKKYRDVVIKFSSPNPRNPSNLAGPDEIELIRYFNENPQTSELRREISLNGTRYIAHVKAMRMEKSCLRCHGDPADAPRKLIEIYGPERSFHLQMSKVVGLDTVAIPVSTHRKLIALETFQNFSMIFIGIVSLFLAVIFILRFMVTERKVLGEVLERKEIEKNAIMNSITDPMVFFESPELTASWANKAALKLANASKENISNAKCYKIWWGIDEPCEFCPVVKTFETGLPNECQIFATDGRYRHLKSFPVKDNRGSMLGVIEIASDITTIKQAEIALEQSEEKFRLLAETSVDMIFQTNKNGYFTYLSRSIEDISGYSVDEVMGTNFSRYLSKLEIPMALEWFQSVISGGTIKAQEFNVTRKDGQPAIFEASFSPVRQGGEIVGVQGIARDITDKIKHQNALRESEEKYRLIFESSPAGIVQYNNQGIITDCNKAFVEMLGVPFEALLGFNIIENGYKPVLVAVRHSLSGEVSYYEGEFTSAISGKSGIGRAVFFPIFSADKTVIGGVGMAENRTEKHRAEQLLRESEKNLETMFDAITESALLVDPNGVFIALNKTTAERLGSGSTVEQMVGKVVWDYLPEDVVMSRRKKLEEVVRTGKEIQFEDIKFGRHVQTAFYPIIDDKGNVVRIAVFTHDIHDVKMAEAELLKFKTISDQANYGATTFDLKGNIDYLNPMFASLHGYHPAELTGKDISIFHTEEQMVHVKQLRKIMLRDGGFTGEEVWHKKKDGSIFPMLMNSFSIKNEKGDTLYGAATTIDITEQKKAQDELIASHEKMRNLAKHLLSVREEERIRIAQELHDELGQALTAINFEASWIAEKLPESNKELKSRAEAAAEFTVGAIQSVKRIISDLRPSLLDDLGLAAAIKWQAQEYQRHMGIEFDVFIDPEDIYLNDDLSTAVFRIFQEATTNAIRHAHARKIAVTLKQNDSAIELKIRDNGIGISEDRLSLNESFGIMGMRERIEVFNGTFELFGIPGKGTTVVARFPF